MGYRKCSKHGWLETSEYTVNESGETICPDCEKAVSGFQMEEPRSYSPNPEVRNARSEYQSND